MTTKLSIRQEEVLNSVYKTLADLVPGGTFINEIIDCHGRIQQARLNKFSEFLHEGFKKVTGQEFDPENLKSEEFFDVFRVIIRKVAETSSEEKLNRYKNVLIKQMIEKNDSEMFMKYISMIDDVTDSQVLILNVLRLYFPPHKCAYHNLMEHLTNPATFSDKLTSLMNDEAIEFSNGAKITQDELKFYLYDLRNRGLLNTIKEQQMQHGTMRQSHLAIDKEEYQISVTGQAFLKFISEYGEAQITSSYN